MMKLGLGLIAFFVIGNSSALTLRQLHDYGKRQKNLAQMALDSPLNDMYQRPPGQNNPEDPIEIKLTAYITEINICEKSQQMTVSGYFRQFWTDPRLAVSTNAGREIIYQPSDMFHDRKIWVPDTFVVEASKPILQEGDAGRTFLRLHNDGYIKTSMRFRAKVLCPVSPNLSSGDTLECHLTFESYGYNAKDVKYSWDENVDSWENFVGKEAREALENSGWKGATLKSENSMTSLNGNTYSGGQLIVTMTKK